MSKIKLIERFSEIGKIFVLEFQTIFKNTAAVMIFFVAILIYPLLYSHTYNNEVLRDVKVAVIDNDNSSLSRKYLRLCDAHENIEIAQRCQDLNEAKELFRKEEVHGIISIPSDFSRNIHKKEQSYVSIYCDASYFLMYKQFARAVTYANKEFNAKLQLNSLMKSGNTQMQSEAKSSPIQYIGVALYNPSEGYASYAMPAVLLLIIQQTLLMGIGVISGYYKEKSKLHFLLPFSEMKFRGSSIVIGKAMMYFLLYVVHLFYVFVIIYKFFEFPMKGEAVDLILLMVPYLLAIIFLGLTLSLIFKRKENAILLLSFTSIPFLFLSGISWPVEAMPTLLTSISKILPSSFVIPGFIKINIMGASLWEAREVWYSLWIQAGVYFVTASLGFRYLTNKAKK